jgi:hypothetical protein
VEDVKRALIGVREEVQADKRLEVARAARARKTRAVLSFSLAPILFYMENSYRNNK